MSHDESRVSCAIGVTNLWSIQTKSEVIVLPTQTLHYSREIPQIYHTFALFDPQKICNLMTPVGSCVFFDKSSNFHPLFFHASNQKKREFKGHRQPPRLN